MKKNTKTFFTKCYKSKNKRSEPSTLECSGGVPPIQETLEIKSNEFNDSSIDSECSDDEDDTIIDLKQQQKPDLTNLNYFEKSLKLINPLYLQFALRIVEDIVQNQASQENIDKIIKKHIEANKHVLSTEVMDNYAKTLLNDLQKSPTIKNYTDCYFSFEDNHLKNNKVPPTFKPDNHDGFYSKDTMRTADLEEYLETTRPDMNDILKDTKNKPSSIKTIKSSDHKRVLANEHSDLQAEISSFEIYNYYKSRPGHVFSDNSYFIPKSLQNSSLHQDSLRELHKNQQLVEEICKNTVELTLEKLFPTYRDVNNCLCTSRIPMEQQTSATRIIHQSVEKNISNEVYFKCNHHTMEKNTNSDTACIQIETVINQKDAWTMTEYSPYFNLNFDHLQNLNYIKDQSTDTYDNETMNEIRTMELKNDGMKNSKNVVPEVDFIQNEILSNILNKVVSSKNILNNDDKLRESIEESDSSQILKNLDVEYEVEVSESLRNTIKIVQKDLKEFRNFY